METDTGVHVVGGHVELDAPGLVAPDSRPTAQVRRKPLWRGWLHLVWFEVSLIVGTAVVLRTHSADKTALVIYAVSVSALFGASALYHRGWWRPGTRKVLQRVDHAMVFILIAGSATPVFAATLRGVPEFVALAVVWTVTAIAISTHLIWMHASDVLVGSMYVALAVIGVACLPVLWINSGVLASLLIGAGGALYVGGALLFNSKRRQPSSPVFGYHEVFHAFVCAGATVHYVAIVWLIT